MQVSSPPWLHLHPEVQSAQASCAPIVALESTVITHGLPRPLNLETAIRIEKEIRLAKAMPATAALYQGEVRLGLAPDELERLALDGEAVKVSRRDIGWVRAEGANGGATVAATMLIACAAGVDVFSTGGIGGVHRGNRGDVSADLPELARTPVAVVCAGAKSILDLARTLEWLETAGVPVLGWQTDEFPAFFSRHSGLTVTRRVDTAEEAASILVSHWEIGASGVLICVPCPKEEAVDSAEVSDALARAEDQAWAQDIHGKELTPFLLSRLSELTDGATLRANLALLRNNAQVAAEIAKALRAIK